jgi:hypothetical protein
VRFSGLRSHIVPVRVYPDGAPRLRAGLRARIGLALLGAALALAPAPRAAALSVLDTVPLWFDGPGGYGFDPSAVAGAGLGPAYSAGAQDGWIDAGGSALGLPIGIDVHLGAVHKNPQAKGRKANRKRPLIADSSWTVTNQSGEDLEDVLLVFTLGDSRGRKRPKPVALDGNLVEILEYSFQGTDYLFGAVRLGDLTAEGPGSSTTIDVRYIVGAGLKKRHGKIFLPPLGVSGLTGWSAVPEPSVLVLTASGLLGLAALRRRR